MNYYITVKNDICARIYLCIYNLLMYIMSYINIYMLYIYIYIYILDKMGELGLVVKDGDVRYFYSLFSSLH